MIFHVRGSPLVVRGCRSSFFVRSPCFVVSRSSLVARRSVAFLSDARNPWLLFHHALLQQCASVFFFLSKHRTSIADDRHEFELR